MELENKFSKIISVIGAILIGIGIIWIIAQNWHIMPAVAKILTLVVGILGLITAGSMLRINNYQMTGNTLLFLSSILFTASVFLIAQIFSTDVTFYGTAMLFLIAWIGVIGIAYTFDQKLILQLGMVEFFIWTQIFFIGIIEKFNEQQYYSGVSGGYYFLVSLLGSLLLFSMYKLHKDHAFEKVYKAWAIFYLLLFGFIMTFQIALQTMWTQGLYLPKAAATYLIALSVIAIFIFVISSIIKKGEPKETPAYLIIFGIYLAFIFSLIYTQSGAHYWYSFNDNPTTQQWFMWIGSNMMYIILLIIMMGYGTMKKYPIAINLAIAFFTVDIISRYIGFIMDFWGYLGLATFFITGGILLIAGGWGIEKWRRNLLKKAQ